MANEENIPQNERSLDERLADFYGPALREQPLSTETWTRLQSHLSSRHARKRRLHHLLRRFELNRRGSIPVSIEQAFISIVDDARLTRFAYPVTLLNCSYRTRLQVPMVRIHSLGKRNMELMLPVERERAVASLELDVLLATGLARLYYMRRSRYRVKWLLLVGCVLLALLILLLFGIHNLSFSFLPIAILLLLLIGTGIAGCDYVLKRNIALRADLLLVQWLGRSRACQGLHLLAGRGKNAAVRRRGWGEPTLRERITRVCGTQVMAEEEQLTLVR